MNKYPPIITDLDLWYRGRGMERQFYATDIEVHQWLTTSLPEKYKPYFLIGSDLIKKPQWSHYRQTPFHCDISQLFLCMQRPDGEKRHSFWILSENITPGILLAEGTDIDGICSYNGLVLLQHGLSNRKVVDPSKQKTSERMSKDFYISSSRIAMTYKMHNEVTGEIRHYDEYLEIYNSLKKAITRSLVYTSRHRNHPEADDFTTILWTEGAYQEYLNGTKYAYDPGRHLKELQREKREMKKRK